MSELPDNNHDEARRWLRNVADDLHVMRMTVADPESPARMTCFLAHLVVEKTLKAALIDAGVPFTKTHDLLELHDKCVATGRLGTVDRSELKRLNPWAIDGRYADDMVEAGRGQAESLASFAEQLVGEVHRILEEPDGGQ